MSPIYSLRGIEKRYGRTLALQIEHLELYPGRSYALLGPNGAGKSTLLEILALLSPPSTGTLAFDGERVRWHSRALRHKRARITLVHQSPYLFDRSVYDNLAFGLSLRDIRGEKQRRAIASALNRVGLHGFEARSARELSGGEAQRVAIARALALDPEVLLLDEPTASIYRETVPVLEGVIDELRHRGTTVVLSTHDLEQAQRLQCEPLQIDGGRLIAAPSPLSSPDRRPTAPLVRPACGAC